MGNAFLFAATALEFPVDERLEEEEPEDVEEPLYTREEFVGVVGAQFDLASQPFAFVDAQLSLGAEEDPEHADLAWRLKEAFINLFYGLGALGQTWSAMRGVFSAGVLDELLEQAFDPSELYIGVSAGACNLASHLAGQLGRNHRIYVDYSCRPEFIGAARFLRGGHAVDLDWLWEITIREIRLDLDAIFARDESYLITLTSVETGEALYLEPTRDDLEEMLRGFLSANAERGGLAEGRLAEAFMIVPSE